jgi:hypothetical protein
MEPCEEAEVDVEGVEGPVPRAPSGVGGGLSLRCKGLNTFGNLLPYVLVKGE